MLPLRTHIGALGSNLWSFLPGLACKEKYRNPYSRKGRMISKKTLNFKS